MINLESTSLRIDNWLQNLDFLFYYSSTIQVDMLRHLSIYVKVAQATILYASCWSPFKDWPLSQWRLIFRWLDKADGIVFICYFLLVFVKFGIENINVLTEVKWYHSPLLFLPLAPPSFSSSTPSLSDESLFYYYICFTCLGLYSVCVCVCV